VERKTCLAKNARSTIADCGWNLFNFVLFNHPAILNRKSCARPNHIRSDDVSTSNAEINLATVLMNGILEEKSKGDAQIETLQKRKIELCSMSYQVEIFKTICILV
jgi:hypothetical protein